MTSHLPYLASSRYIDWHHPAVAEKAAQLAVDTVSEADLVNRCFEFVRDEIRHSGDHKRNPVTCALSLAASFTGLAALFLSLDAYFIGIIQILVYAGAVMVLFLFIIMLLDIKHEEGKKLNLAPIVAGIVVAVLVVVQIAAVVAST